MRANDVLRSNQCRSICASEIPTTSRNLRLGIARTAGSYGASVRFQSPAWRAPTVPGIDTDRPEVRPLPKLIDAQIREGVGLLVARIAVVPFDPDPADVVP